MYSTSVYEIQPRGCIPSMLYHQDRGKTLNPQDRDETKSFYIFFKLTRLRGSTLESEARPERY